MQLAIERVSKVYSGNIRALTDFSLEVAPGILGLLGPNGAGKSSLMRILASVTKLTHGSHVEWRQHGAGAGRPSRGAGLPAAGFRSLS